MFQPSIAAASSSAASSSSSSAASSSTGMSQHHLGLENIPALEKCVITFAPLNSSGDIYHILAYLILARHYNRPLQDVQLSYDSEPAQWALQTGPNHSALNVGDQVLRAQYFAETLSFQGVFVPKQQTYMNCKRENARHDQLMNRLQEEAKTTKQNLWYMDQMACTTILSSCSEQLGYPQMTNIIRDGFSKRDEAFFPRVIQAQVDTEVTSWLSRIDQSATMANQPLVIFHIRHSSKANKEQNFPDTFIHHCVKNLAMTHHYNVCAIVADDRKGKMQIEGVSNIAIIEPFKGNKFFVNGRDYAKQAHLQLLLGLQSNPRTRAIIGNTSGTLDLAAFIGIQTYSIHQFSKATMSYQECRLFIQMWFMSIDALVKSGDNYELSQPLENWLKNPSTHCGPTQWGNRENTYNSIMAKRNNAGFDKMFSLTLFSNNNQFKVHLVKSALDFNDEPCIASSSTAVMP